MNISQTTGADLLAAEAVRAREHGADVQYSHTTGVIDLTWGHPDPSALATDVVAEATTAVLAAEGWKVLTYGAPAGAMVVREAVAEHDSAVDHPIDADEVLITAGSSGGLDLLLSLRAVPGDVVFVEQPTYFLALRIFRDHGLRVIGLTNDAGGPDPDDLERRAREHSATGSNCLLYLVTTFANPTGRCLDRARAEQLLEVAASHGVTVIDDDVYRDTVPSAPPSLHAIDPTVLRLGSFSKSISPGLRVGYVVASPHVVAEIAGCGVLDSGGGNNHFAAMVAGEIIRSGRFDDLVRQGHVRYAARRKALSDALRNGPFTFDEPQGGFFVWLRLDDGIDSAATAAAAHANGVLVSDGRNFFDTDPPAGFLRLSFSMLDEDLLAEGARRLRDSFVS
jgi:DNA-binding transcriptional MocR family regulator